MDRLVLGDGPPGRVRVGQPSPGPGAQGASGDVLQQGGQGLVAGGADHRPVEVRVVLEQQFHVVPCVPHGRQVPFHLGEVLVRDAGGGQRGGGRLEEPAHLGEFQDGVPLEQFDRAAEPFQQQAGGQAGHVGAVAAPDLQHPGDDQRLDRLAHQVPGQAELGRELLLGGQLRSRGKFAVPDHLADAGDGFVSQGHGANVAGDPMSRKTSDDFLRSTCRWDLAVHRPSASRPGRRRPILPPIHPMYRAKNRRRERLRIRRRPSPGSRRARRSAPAGPGVPGVSRSLRGVLGRAPR